MKWLSILLVFNWIAPVFSQTSYPPPFKFRVDSVSLLATWQSPKTVILAEDFEGEAFPPAGWTVSSLGVGWQRVTTPDFWYWACPQHAGHYGLANDDVAGWSNNGSMDYMVTPILDLTIAESFKICFDSYFDGAYGQRAFVEFSTDSGQTWQMLKQLDASLEWEEQVVDLSGFSGPVGDSTIQFAFHADDFGYFSSGWAVDNIYFYSDEIAQQPLDYKIFLDDESIGQTSDHSFQYAFPYNSDHNCGMIAEYTEGISDTVWEPVHSWYLPKPANLVGIVPGDEVILQWNPPSDTNFLLGFIVYKNGDSLDFTEFNGEEICEFVEYLELCNWFGYAEYEVSSVYDLSGYGFPGTTGESGKEGPVMIFSAWYLEMDFYEDWSSGSFSDNFWCTTDNNWQVSGEIGHVAPAAVLYTDAITSSYESSLQSFQFLVPMPEFPEKTFLSFDLLLSSNQSTGSEELILEVYDPGTDNWKMVKAYSNAEGSFGWLSDTLEITNDYNGEIFSFRFRATGENPSDIEYWAIDNISLRLSCKTPENVEAVLDPDSIDHVKVTWDVPSPAVAEWWQWDDGVHYSSLSGVTGKENWSAVAQRWTPAELTGLKGAWLTAIGFVPGEGPASYNIAVWTGEERDTVCCQATGNLVLDEWNIFQLDPPIKVDITKELLVGYQLATITGYPMSVDDGPAIDSFGNLIQMGPSWRTLLEINPDLDYNWNIKAFFERDSLPVESYEVYRSIDGSSFEMLAEVNAPEYLDTYLIAPSITCYAVNAEYPYEVCISGLSEEDCILLTEVPEEVEGGYRLLVFPNPASDFIQIEIRDDISLNNSKGDDISTRFLDGDVISIVKLLNSNGKIFLEKEINANSFTLPVADYPPGIYLLRIETGNGVVSKKVVIMR